MNALRVLILTVALLAPGLIPALCGESCGTSACSKSAAFTACFTDEPASCCSPAAPSTTTPTRSPNPTAPRSPISCCCIVQGPMEPPRAPQTPPQQAPDELPVTELPRPWTTLEAFDHSIIRGITPAASPPWTPGGGSNPIQSVLCIWRN